MSLLDIGRVFEIMTPDEGTTAENTPWGYPFSRVDCMA
jgi:hypothetical protein